MFGILCDISGSMEGVKILAARAAITRLVSMLPEECSFFIVNGSDTPELISAGGSGDRMTAKDQRHRGG